MACLVLFVANSAIAQIDFGLRVAVTSSTINLDDLTTGVTEGTAQVGYQFGVYARIKLVGLYVQPELLFSNSSSVLNVAGTGDVDLSFNKIDVPIMLGMKLGPLRVQAGPALSFITSAETESPTGVVDDVTDNYNSTTIGYQAGIGVDILKFVIDLKYEGSLGNIADALPGWVNTDQRSSQWVLAVGFKLF